MNETAPEPEVPKGPLRDLVTLGAALVAASKQFDGSSAWWRGHQNADWTLTPAIYREGRTGKERNLNARFRLGARARRPDCPDATAALDWLFLMQHYSLPTRLLDWSQSPLVALWFALQGEDDCDAALWALAPDFLNEREFGTRTLMMPGVPHLRRLSIQAFRDDSKPTDQRVFAVLAEEADPRHLVQQAAFTIHGRPDPLENSRGAGNYLMCFRIPKERRASLRTVVELLGVNRAVLFPDLENLAEHLLSLDFMEDGTAGSADS